MKKLPILFISLLSIFQIYAQKEIAPLEQSDYRDANAVIRKYEKKVEFNNFSSLDVKEYKLTTVLNAKGNKAARAYAYYDDDLRLKNVEAIIYDANGQRIKKIKEKDFKDESAVDGSTLYSDSRIKYLNYKPTGYPYSVAFIKEYKTKNTSFVPGHSFIPGYDIYVQESSYKLLFDKTETTFNIKEKNFENFEIEKQENPAGIFYTLKEVEPIPNENLNLPWQQILPWVSAMSHNFHLSGYKGENISNWEGLGKWFHDQVLENRTDLPAATIKKVQALTANVEDPIEKAKIVYNYVQNNTRYISVQVGIGGYQPIEASEVDEMKYGDCKGLSNYTQALLNAVGVPAYYTHVEAGKTKIDFEEDFASLAQGNHVILAIPYKNDYKWIDCTSQTQPFGFLGDFTDDRRVLVMKPDGGEIVKTPAYINEDNYQKTTASVHFTENGKVNIEGEIITKGNQYNSRQYLEHYSPKDLEKRDFRYWSSIDNLEIEEHSFHNDKEAVSFTETFKISGNNFVTQTNDHLFAAINPISAITYIPQRYRNRKTPFHISRGYLDEDSIEIFIPKNYTIASKPENVTIETEFGSYTMSLQQKKNSLVYTKRVLIKDGVYPKEKYAAYREFRKKISNAENQKLVLKKRD